MLQLDNIRQQIVRFLQISTLHPDLLLQENVVVPFNGQKLKLSDMNFCYTLFASGDPSVNNNATLPLPELFPQACQVCNEWGSPSRFAHIRVVGPQTGSVVLVAVPWRSLASANAANW